MSEYQYYEFVAVDRPLDSSQMGQLRALSTRARITPTGFVNSYQWGDFRGDPQALMERYFDAFLYLANWGMRRVMFRLPDRLLGLPVAQRYCVGESAQAWARGHYVVVDLFSEDEEGDWQEDGEGRLAAIVPVRAELASGDLRALYLAWLGCVQAGELDDGEPEPPVPPGLGTLSAALRGLADFLRIDEDLLAVGAEDSRPMMDDKPSKATLTRWVESLPAAEKDAALLRLVSGDDAQLRTELLRRFHGRPASNDAENGSRIVGQLLATAETRRLERQRKVERRRAVERVRRERAAAAAREERLQDLAAREEQAWQRVAALIDTKRPREYDAAIELLRDLRQVNDRNGDGAGFIRRLRGIRAVHRRKGSFIRRLDRAGLVVE